MNTTKSLLKKSSQVVIAVTACLQLCQCDSSTDLTFNPDANFEIAERYNKEALDDDLGALVDMPAFLLTGDRVTIDAVEVLDLEDNIIDDDVDAFVNSSGQLFIDNFRFNYNNRFGSDDNVAFLLRSEDHAIGEGEDEFVDSLLQLRDTSFGSGSLAEALTINPNDLADGFVTFTERQRTTIRNAIKSLGYEVRDDGGFMVLADQYFGFEAESTNQLLVDDNKITGNVIIVKVWRQLIFEFETTTTIDDIIFDNDPTLTGTEYKITLGSESEEINTGLFEIKLNSL